MVQVGVGCSNPVQVKPYSAQLDTWSRGQRLCSCASDSWLLYLTTTCGHDCYDMKPAKVGTGCSNNMQLQLTVGQVDTQEVHSTQ